MPISYAKRTNCQVCRVPSMRKPRRSCAKCSLMVCADCRKAKLCCAKRAVMNAKIAEQAEAKKNEQTDG